MKSIITLILLLVSITGYSQSLTIQDLIKLQDSEIVDTEDLLIAYGYKFASTSEKNEVITYLYEYSQNKKGNEFYVFTHMYKNFKLRTIYTIHSQNLYSDIKKSLNQLDFKFENTERLENGIKHIYYRTDDKYKVELTTVNSSDGNDYLIVLSDVQNLITYELTTQN